MTREQQSSLGIAAAIWSQVIETDSCRSRHPSQSTKLRRRSPREAHRTQVRVFPQVGVHPIPEALLIVSAPSAPRTATRRRNDYRTVTRPPQLPDFRYAAHYNSGIVRLNDASKLPRLGLLIAVAAVAWVLATDDQCELRGFESSASPAHALVSSLGSEFAVVDHLHLWDGSSTKCPEAFATAVLARSSTASVALGVVVAVVAGAVSLTQSAVAAGRGPPRAAAVPFTGQDLLTRFCLSRR